MSFSDIFEELARVNDRSIIWSNWLDYCIHLNLLNNDARSMDFKGNEGAYSEMLGEWLIQLNEDLETRPYSDRLGLFYEELIVSYSKSKNLGQFYTPDNVSDLMNDLSLINNDFHEGFVNDCACGSARMLLSAHVKSKGDLICIGQDIDEISCKMAVLNFWSHGVRGSILHQNTLTGEYYSAWRINTYLYHGLPIPHIELVSPREAYYFIGIDNIEHKTVEINPIQKGTVQTKLM